MNIRRFSEPETFQQEIEVFLARHEAENNLPLGILSGILAGEYRENEPYLGLVEDNSQPCLAALCTPPYPAIISYQDPAPKQRAIELLMEDLMEVLGGDLKGISAEKWLAGKMKTIWEKNSGKKARLQMSMRIYKLEKVIDPTGISGYARPAREDDREIMQDYYAGFAREAVGDELDRDRVSKQVDNYLNADVEIRGLWFWEVDQRLVSMAGYAGPTPNGIRIGAVYTPPEERKKGFASAVTAAVSQHLLDRGYQFCFLFTDLLNPTSNHIYQQIGYRPVCDVDRYDFY